jgi:hypothetical protein
MHSNLETCVARYREISEELWRISIDAGQSVSFETRARLATIADEFEELAARIEDEIEAD